MRIPSSRTRSPGAAPATGRPSPVTPSPRAAMRSISEASPMSVPYQIVGYKAGAYTRRLRDMPAPRRARRAEDIAAARQHPAARASAQVARRSEERRVGEEDDVTGRYKGSQYQ